MHHSPTIHRRGKGGRRLSRANIRECLQGRQHRLSQVFTANERKRRNLHCPRSDPHLSLAAPESRPSPAAPSNAPPCSPAHPQAAQHTHSSRLSSGRLLVPTLSPDPRRMSRSGTD